MARREKRSGVSVMIPSGPVGRAIDALTDIIRPFSEARGLKADQIRLQREDVLIEVAKRAKERLVIEKQPIKPVSNKLLVPLLEAASNEDIEDGYMVDMWAKLLASAATDATVEPRFIGILRELRAEQAQLLYALATHRWDRHPVPTVDLATAPDRGWPDYIRRRMRALLPPTCREVKSGRKPDMDRVVGEMLRELDYPGSAVISITQLFM